MWVVDIGVGMVTTCEVGTLGGTFDDEIITKVVDWIVTTFVSDVGTSYDGTTTGEVGKTDNDGIGKVDVTVDGTGVTTVTTYVAGNVLGTFELEIMTNVVPGIVTTFVSEVGTTVEWIITGEVGNTDGDGIGKVWAAVVGTGGGNGVTGGFSHPPAVLRICPAGHVVQSVFEAPLHVAHDGSHVWQLLF